MKSDRTKLREEVTGRAVETGDGLLHVEATSGVTLCGQPVETYPLHWDTKTVIGCGPCLLAVGAAPVRRPSLYRATP